MNIQIEEALTRLSKVRSPFLKVFEHGILSVEIYKPDKIDLQQPHTRDEVYVIISGTGEFLSDGVRTGFSPGDLYFVPAGIDHRFENFSIDFSVWVIFYGPQGGEKDKITRH